MRAVYAENALELNKRLSLVGALRYDQMELDRQNFDAQGVDEGNGFTRDYGWWSWRAGVVVDATDETVLYGQYSDARDPINSNIFLVSSNQDFDLTSARQWEVGLKSTLFDGRAEATFAYYDIRRDDILERFSLDNATNVGGRDSQGAEVMTVISPSDDWRVGGNAGYTRARFRRSANFQALAGNTPPNVPTWTANGWTSVSTPGPLPLDLSGSVRWVSERFGDNANSVRLGSYALLGASAAWDWTRGRLSAGVDNLFDAEYVPWSEIAYVHQNDPSFLYANQLMLGSPRTFWVRMEIR